MKLDYQSKRKKLQYRLELYYEAEEKILARQSFTIGSRSLTMADLKEVQDMIKSLESQIEAIDSLGTTKRRVARVIPRDI